VPYLRCICNGAIIQCCHRRRYGLLGPNGCGKSCLLKAISARELPIPDHIDIYHLGARQDIVVSCHSRLGRRTCALGMLCSPYRLSTNGYMAKQAVTATAVSAEREMEASDKTALEAVMSVNEEKLRLEAKAEQLNTMEGPEVEQLLIDIYEKCASAHQTRAQGSYVRLVMA